MTNYEIADKRVARQLLGYFINNDYMEVVNIEYRYTHDNEHQEFSIFTRIQDREYQFTESHFFAVLADLLDQLPITSAIMIPHQIIVLRNNTRKITTLEEWLFPYENREVGGTVKYQLKLHIDGSFFETPRDIEGYPVIDFSTAAELLRKELDADTQILACYYCGYLIGYEENGGTDHRHDLLACFRDSYRDNLETLNELLNTFPTTASRKPLMAKGTPDMDAFHSCSAFVYRETQVP